MASTGTVSRGGTSGSNPACSSGESVANLFGPETSWVVSHVADPRAHRPTRHPFRRIGSQKGLELRRVRGFLADAVEALAAGIGMAFE